MPRSTSVLIAAPTSEAKDYSYPIWRKAIYDLSLPSGCEAKCLVVDNSPSPEYHTTIADPYTEVLHLSLPEGETVPKVNRSWKLILECAWRSGMDYVFSVETDVIVPPDALAWMLGLADVMHAKTVAHSYPQRGKNGRDGFLLTALGCTLIRTEYFPPDEMRPVNWEFEGWVFHKPRSNGDIVICVDNLFPIKHLEEP